jgi:hypothetical protein
MDEKGILKCFEVIGAALNDKEPRHRAAEKTNEMLTLKLREANLHLDQYATLNASLEKEVTQLRHLKRCAFNPDDYYLHRILDGWVACKVHDFMEAESGNDYFPFSNDSDPVKALDRFIKTGGKENGN